MAQVKTSELQGVTLDWAVAKCEGWHTAGVNYPYLAVKHGKPATRWTELRYSTNWAQGGPIIERDHLILRPYYTGDWECAANPNCWQSGPSPLVAAMRCYVASKLGEEVDVPDEISDKR